MWFLSQTTQPSFFSPGVKQIIGICTAITVIGTAIKTLYSFGQFLWPKYLVQKKKVNKVLAWGWLVIYEICKPIALIGWGRDIHFKAIGNERLYYWVIMLAYAMIISLNTWLRYDNRRSMDMIRLKLKMIETLEEVNKSTDSLNQRNLAMTLCIYDVLKDLMTPKMPVRDALDIVLSSLWLWLGVYYAIWG